MLYVVCVGTALATADIPATRRATNKRTRVVCRTAVARRELGVWRLVARGDIAVIPVYEPFY